MNAKELESDLAELRRLRNLANRPHVQKVLDDNISQTECKIAELKKSETPQENGVHSAASASSAADVKATATFKKALPLQKIVTYAWDQSDRFVKIYVTVEGVESASQDQIKAAYSQSSIGLHVSDVNGKNYEMTINNLLGTIKPEDSYFKLKKDTILLMLPKEKASNNWQTLTKVELMVKEKRAPKMAPGDDKEADPQASMMNMMKQMYDEGDDEMKRQIRKSWHQAQDGKGGAPGAGGGGGAPGGMGGMMGGMGGMGGMMGGMGMGGMEGMLGGMGMGDMPGMEGMGDLGGS